MTLHDGVSLGNARQWLRERVADGARCPCCNQWTKVYKRKLNSGMALALIDWWMYRRHEWVHVERELLKRARFKAREHSKLRYWGLIEEGTGGLWRITPEGESFVRDRLTVPSHALIYDANLRRLTGDPVSIRVALGRRFDYDELMREPGR